MDWTKILAWKARIVKGANGQQTEEKNYGAILASSQHHQRIASK
jgi:hypothetical protein